MISGIWRCGLAVTMWLLVAGVWADDVVFSAAHLRQMGQGFTATESAHLYRVHEDGSGLTQLTSGSTTDTNPCLSADGSRILFWRRDRNDLVGNIRLCSIGVDGTDLKTLGNYNEVDLTRPSDAAHFLSGDGKLNSRVFVDRLGDIRVKVTLPGSKSDVFSWAAVSPSGRYAVASGKEVGKFIVDLASGKSTPLKGMRSPEGGTDVPNAFAWLDDHTVFCSMYDIGATAELFSTKTNQTEYFHVCREVNGHLIDKNVFEDTQWGANPDGEKAFWFNQAHQQILFQVVTRSKDGGKPAVYCVRRSDGLIRFQIAGYFLENAKSDGSEFLTTTWKWGNSFEKDGATPLRKLEIWDGRTLKPRQLGFDLAACDGAFFLPATPETKGLTNTLPPSVLPSTPTEPKATIQVSQPSGASETRVVFAASRFGENLGNLYSLGPSHLYSILTSGTDLRQITAGAYFDVEPTVSLDGKHLLFWRSADVNEPYGNRYGLFRVNLDGSDLQRLTQPVSGNPSEGLTHALERASLGFEGTTQSIRNVGWSVIRGSAVLLYNPSGTRVMTVSDTDADKDTFIGDLKTRQVVRIDKMYKQPIWLGNDRVVAFVGDSNQNIAILDMSGHKVGSAIIPDREEFDGIGVYGRKAFLLGGRGAAILQFHHHMSDGGYDYTYMLNLNKSKSIQFDAATVECVSPEGWMFIIDSFSWVGGYKGDGAEKVGRLTLVNERTHQATPIGFRRMICQGACFIEYYFSGA